MNTPAPAFAPRVSRHARRLAALIAGLSSVAISQGAEIYKANNGDAMNTATSWDGGVVPGENDIAIFDSRISANTFVQLTANQSLGGLRVVNNAPGLYVDSFLSGASAVVLSLGASGLDLSGATSGNTVVFDSPTINLTRAQTWSIADGATAQLIGPLSRAAGATLNFDLGATGTGAFTATGFGTPGAILPYATVKGADFAALNAGTRNIVPGATLGIYTPNPNTGANNPDLVGTHGTMDVINSNTGGINAVRVSSSTGLTTAGIRFGTPHATGANWVVDIPSGRNFNLGNQGIVVSPALGTQNVSFNGAGNIRLADGSQLTIHQHNTSGDLILNAQMNQPAGVGVIVTKTGPGRAIFASNGNAYGGGTVISQGTLQIGNGGTTGVLGGGDVTNHGSLVFNRSDAVTVVHNIHGTGSVTKLGAGELSFTTNASTYTGATNLNGGTLAFNSLGNLGTGTAINFNGGALRWGTGNIADITARTVTIEAGGATLHTNGNDVSFANALGNSGAGGLTKAGLGSLTLNAASTYAGATTINGGALVAANTSGSATGAGAVTVNSGGALAGTGSVAGVVTVNTGGKIAPGAGGVGTLTVGGLTLQSGSLVDVEFSAAPANDRVVVSNSGGLSIAGGAVSVLAAGTSNGWTTPGTYQIFQYSGALQGAGASALSVLNPRPGYSYAFGASGGFVTLNIAELGLITQWTLNGSGSFAQAGNWSGGVPTGAGATANFTTSLAGPATVTLDGTRTLAGLSFDSANPYTLAAGTNGVLVFSNGDDVASVAIDSGNHVISAPVSLTSDLSVSGLANTSLTITGEVIGAGDLTKSGPGTLAVSGNNQIVGTTLVAGGVLEFGQLSSLGNGAITLNNGTLRYGAGNTADLSGRALEIGINGGTIDTNGNSVVFAQPFGNSGGGSFTKAGAGVLTLADGNTYAGTTQITGGSLRIASNLGLNAAGVGVTLDGGTLSTTASFTTDRTITVGASGGGIETAADTTLTLTPGLAGAGVLTKSGAGTLVLTNASTRTAGIALNAGTLALANSSAGGSGPIAMANGTTLNVATNATTFSGNPVNIADGATVTMIGGNITGAYSGSNVTGAANTRLIIGGTTQVNFGAAATQQLAGMQGTVEIPQGATLRFSNSNLNNGGISTSFELAGTISGRNNGTVNLGKLTGTGTLSGSGGADTNTTIFAVGGKNEDSTFAGLIVDSNVAVGRRAALTKNGTGTFTLTNAHAYTGATLINTGTLRVLGSLGGTTTTVGYNTTTFVAGTLAGNGTLAGPVIVNGNLRPDATGTLGGRLSLGSASTLSFGANATTQFDFSGTTFTGVTSAAPGGVTFGGALRINYLGTIYNGSYSLFQLTGAKNGTFASVSATSAVTGAPVVFTREGSVWTGTVDGANLSFDESTGVLSVINGAQVVGLPATPGGVGAVAGNGSVSLAWNAVADADNYLVKRATTAGGPYTTLTSAVVTTNYVDDTTLNGTTYYYVIQAQNEVGLSANSTEVSATPTAVVLSALQSWRVTNFGSSENTGNGADNADPDADGIPNLLEYASNRNPNLADATPVLALGRTNDGLSLAVTYTRIADPALVYTVQGANALSGTPVWSTVATSTGSANVAGPVTVNDTQTIAASSRRFLRLQVGYANN
ncbi:MAG: autotransporter-associated beta strand repeat-containing protein [Opitutaceae bacterium]|nr:autotransporter-associated beta strand repeat-containing protein [Opitutaceae bacterium]